MDITLNKPLSDNPHNIMRRAGYSEHYDPNTGKTSFSLRLGSGRYPRFHCYVKESDANVTFSLHIDQKQASYEGSHMHAGEYDGKLVEDEIGRIQRWALAGIKRTSGNKSEAEDYEESTPGLPSPPALSPKPEKRSLFGKLFGRGDRD